MVAEPYNQQGGGTILSAYSLEYKLADSAAAMPH